MYTLCVVFHTHYITLCYIVLPTLHCITLYYIILHYITLYYIVLHCMLYALYDILHYITLYYAQSPY